MPLRWFFASLLLLGSCFAQNPKDARPTFLVNEELRVTGLPTRTASPDDGRAIVAAALETVIHDVHLCCGKDSVLETALVSTQLDDLGKKIEGKYVLPDGYRIEITVEYVPPSAITPSKLLAPLKRNQASLIEWKSNVYVLYGAIFDEVRDSDFQIHKLLLLDTRYSDSRRQTSLDREGTLQTALQGLLLVNVEAQ